MDEKIITLTDGTKLEVKVNFMTLYLIQKHGLDKVINKRHYQKMRTWKRPQS